MSVPARVLLVEDDEAVRELVSLHLRRGGFRVVAESTSESAWRHVAKVDAIVLDRMLPDESGDSFLVRVRSNEDSRRVPVLMLTARASEVDRVEGLEAGADDYVTKPFSAMELLARMRALVRRLPRSQPISARGLEIDVENASVHKDGQEVALSRREFELLAYLFSYPARVFTRSELLDQVWGGDYVGGERTVDQHVSQLRRRLGSWVIETVRGRGYRSAATDGGD